MRQVPPIACQVQAHTDALPYVTHMTFVLRGTEELGQTLHSRNQHNVGEALKRICKNDFI